MSLKEKHDKKREIAAAHVAVVPEGTRATPQERGFAECPCPKKCTLHGECLLCVAYHGRKNSLPRCERQIPDIPAGRTAKGGWIGVV